MNELPLILVVDDDPDICTMIRVMLEYNNYRALTAENEVQAIEIIDNNKVDFVIMDMLLSGANGTDICRRIKSDPRSRHIPVMMFSAHPNAREQCLAAGADEFMAKPFEMQEMLSKVKSFVHPATES